MVTAVAVVDEIEVTFTKSGEIKWTFPREAWEKAKADGSLPWLIDSAVCKIEDDVLATEPDGTTFNPYWMAG